MCLGIPGIITQIYQTNSLAMGKIDFGGVSREICLAYVPEAQVGDYALVHAGFALNLISETEAQETLALLNQISGLEQKLNESK